MFLAFFELVIPIITLIGFGISGCTRSTAAICAIIILYCTIVVSIYNVMQTTKPNTERPTLGFSVFCWLLGLPLSMLISYTIRHLFSNINILLYILMILGSVASVIVIVVYAIHIWKKDVMYYFGDDYE